MVVLKSKSSVPDRTGLLSEPRPITRTLTKGRFERTDQDLSNGVDLAGMGGGEAPRVVHGAMAGMAQVHACISRLAAI